MLVNDGMVALHVFILNMLIIILNLPIKGFFISVVCLKDQCCWVIFSLDTSQLILAVAVNLILKSFMGNRFFSFLFLRYKPDTVIMK